MSDQPIDKKLDRKHRSDLDDFLAELASKAGPSSSQRAEMAKYDRIARLRDDSHAGESNDDLFA